MAKTLFCLNLLPDWDYFIALEEPYQNCQYITEFIQQRKPRGGAGQPKFNAITRIKYVTPHSITISGMNITKWLVHEGTGHRISVDMVVVFANGEGRVIRMWQVVG